MLFPSRTSGSGPLPWEARSGQAAQSHFLAVPGRSVAEFWMRSRPACSLAHLSCGKRTFAGLWALGIRWTARAGHAGRRPRVRAGEPSIRLANTFGPQLGARGGRRRDPPVSKRREQRPEDL